MGTRGHALFQQQEEFLPLFLDVVFAAPLEEELRFDAATELAPGASVLLVDQIGVHVQAFGNLPNRKFVPEAQAEQFHASKRRLALARGRPTVAPSRLVEDGSRPGPIENPG